MTYLQTIASYLADSPDDLKKYVLNQSFTKRELAKLAKENSSPPIREWVTEELLKRRPTFNQLCHLLTTSSTHFSEVVDRIVERFPNPSARQVEKVSYLFQIPPIFWALGCWKNRPAVIKFGQYILAHSNTPKHLMGSLPPRKGIRRRSFRYLVSI